MRSSSWSSIAHARGARRGVLSALLAGALLLAMVQPAAAQLVDRSHQHIVLTIPNDEVCGVPVSSTIDLIANDQQRLAKSGFPLFNETGPGSLTWTNPATGKSVSFFFTGAAKDLTVVDNGDGTITVRTEVTGVPVKLTLSDGTIAAMDVGRVVLVSVIDYHGTPTNPDDDELVSQTIESVAGPHPVLESEGALFCEVVVAGLT